MIYLDNNATTTPEPETLEEMNRVAREATGNPGSRHLAGRRARQVLEEARESIAEMLGAEPNEVVFTSGGTESTNLAIFGLTAGRTGTVLMPPGEHPATEESVQRLIQSGWQQRLLSLDSLGRLDPQQIDETPLDDVSLATAMLAHNETGVIHNLEPLAIRCREHGVPFHVDAVQAVGKIDVSFRQLPATTMSVGAHKFYGPRGIGVLLVRAGTSLAPYLFGGHQERGFRPGTEPVMLIAGMNFALRRWYEDRSTQSARLAELRDRLQQGLAECCAPVVVNGDQEHRLPNTLNIAFPGCEADALLVAFDLAGICCSLGSACSSGSTEPSAILVAMGLSREIMQSSLRLSVGIHNTSQEIDEAVRIISKTVDRLRSSNSG